MNSQGFSGQRPINQPTGEPIGIDGLAFLRLILPAQGWYFAVEVAENGSYWHRPFNSIALLHTHLVRRDRLGRTMYHANAAFREPEVWNPNKLNKRTKQKGAWEWRTHDNVRALKVLLIDIDSRETKPNAKYADRVEAYRALVPFCEAAGLPLPLIVSSGGGIHAYWVLEIELTPAQWQPLANGLKAACEKFGLDADPARTADSSSVLRTPGTHHRKSGRIVEAGAPAGPYPLAAFEHLKNFPPKEQRKTVRRRPQEQVRIGGSDRQVGTKQPSRGVGKAARANIYDPSDPAKVVTACRQLAAFAQNPGAYREPFHYLAAGVFGHCKDGARFYLNLLDDEWKEAGQNKLNQWMAGGWGPATCEKFASENKGSCVGCHFFDASKEGDARFKITSPIQLGTQAHARHTIARRWRHIRHRRNRHTHAAPRRGY